MQTVVEGDSLLQMLASMSDKELAEARKLIRVLMNRRETLRAVTSDDKSSVESRRVTRKKKSVA